MSVFKIDGRTYDVFVNEIKRTFQVLDGSNTARNLEGEMYRDVIGTFYNYSISIDPKLLSEEEYDSLYEVISSPDSFHSIEMPYGQTVYSFQGYITSGSDKLSRVNKNKLNEWDGLQFNIIAKEPKRRSV